MTGFGLVYLNGSSRSLGQVGGNGRLKGREKVLSSLQRGESEARRGTARRGWAGSGGVGVPTPVTVRPQAQFSEASLMDLTQVGAETFRPSPEPPPLLNPKAPNTGSLFRSLKPRPEHPAPAGV